MSSQYRSLRPSRTYLERIQESWNAETLLAPDITTARERVAPSLAPAPQSAPARTPARTEPATRDTTSVLEARHPDIARAIALLWGFPEMNEYFDRLWLAEGNHGPIDPDAMSELMLLSRVHQGILPQRPGRSLASFYGPNRGDDSFSRPPIPGATCRRGASRLPVPVP